MVIVIEEKDLYCNLKENVISRFGDETIFCSPDNIANISLRTVIFADIYYDALSFCLINGFEIKFLYGDRVFSYEDIGVINLIQKDLLKSSNYSEVKKLNLMKIFIEACRRKTILFSLPAHLQLEHTTYCNARCIMCDHYISHNRGAKHLDLATVSRLRSVLPYISMITMHGNGEPFLNPDIINILELYKQYGIRISTNTNLSYINDDICSELNQMCDNLQISCDGCDKESYEGIRQGLSFDTFCHNLDRICSLSMIKKISLEVVLMQQNIRKAKDIVEFAHSYGIKIVKFHDLGINNVIGNERYSLCKCPNTGNKYISIAQEEGERLGVEVRGVKYSNTCLDSDESELYSVFPDKNISVEMHKKYEWYTNVIAFKDICNEDLFSIENDYGGVCEYPFAKSYIDLNGNVSVCCPTSRKVIGRISSTEDFVSLWNSGTMIKIREKFYAGMMPSFCSNCFMISEHSLSWIDYRKGRK